MVDEGQLDFRAAFRVALHKAKDQVHVLQRHRASVAAAWICPGVERLAEVLDALQGRAARIIRLITHTYMLSQAIPQNVRPTTFVIYKCTPELDWTTHWHHKQ